MPSQDYATHRHNPKLTGLGFVFLMIAVVAFALGHLDFRSRWGSS